MTKIFPDSHRASAGVGDGATVMVGGFGSCGIPKNLIGEVEHKGVRNSIVIRNNVGIDGFGTGTWIEKQQVR